MTVLAWIAAAACVLGAVAVLGLRRRRTVVLQLADTGALRRGEAAHDAVVGSRRRRARRRAARLRRAGSGAGA